MIRVLQRNEVDEARWNACVAKSHKADVYALTWFLDIVLPTWQAAVYGDYEFVMPLYTKRKWGILPVFKTPYFVKEVAVYPENGAPHEAFAAVLRSHYRKSVLKDVNVSSGLYEHLGITGVSNQFQVAPSWNMQQFPSKELRKNVESFELEAEVINNVSFSEYSSFVRKHFPYPVAKDAWPKLQALADRQETKLCGVRHNGELIAVQMMVYTMDTVFFIQNATHSDFRKSRVMPWLMHRLVGNLENCKKVHFMGSNNEAVASFNKKFGATAVTCFRVRN